MILVFSIILMDRAYLVRKMSQFVINTKEKLKEKLDMVASLGDMEIASRIMEIDEEELNEIDKNYKNLKCKLEPIPKSVLTSFVF
jgi:hypothetical protein